MSTATFPHPQARFRSRLLSRAPALVGLGLGVALLLVTMPLVSGGMPPAGRIEDPKPAPKDPNSAAARSARWVLRIQSSDGKDYIKQLAALDAVLLVPVPPDNKTVWYIPDLQKPTEKRLGTDDDLKKLGGLVKFSDTRAESVKGVREVLGVKDEAKSFWVFLPHKVEDDLARKETGYRNRQVEDIQETAFRVITRNGKPEIVVDDQTVQR